MRVEPKDARAERFESISVALARQDCILRDRSAIAVVIQLDAVPVDTGVLARELVLETTNDQVSDFHFNYLDRDACARRRHSSIFILIGLGVDGGTADRDVLFHGGQITLEDIRVPIHIG